MKIDDNIIKWLLSPEDPSLRYRTMTELLDVSPDDPEVTETRSLIPGSKAIMDIFGKMHPDGYWLQKNPRSGIIYGSGVEYGAFATTHFCLAYLTELGLDKNHPLVFKAADRYLNLVQPDGDFWNHFSCLYGYNIRNFILLGFKDDPRLNKSINLMLNTIRKDGGYLCDMHEKRSKTGNIKSCIRGSVKTLLAFSELPEYWNHPRCQILVNYFLNRGGIFKSYDSTQYVNKDVERFSFPTIWRLNIWEILYSLGKMGYGSDKRLNKAWELLESRMNTDGTYNLDWTPTQCPWKVGMRGNPNPWITFYILLAYKHKENTGVLT